MAKLSAHGTELLRASKTVDTPNDSIALWQRRTIVYMSDGKKLTKNDVRFRASAYNPERTHSYGWKRAGQFNGKDIEVYRASMAPLAEKLTAAGWTVEQQ